VQANGEHFSNETLAGINPGRKAQATRYPKKGRTRKKPTSDRITGEFRTSTYASLYDKIVQDVGEAVGSIQEKRTGKSRVDVTPSVTQENEMDKK
jgi:hypothetical protein